MAESRVIQKYGFNVLPVYSAAKAITAAAQNDIDLVLMDIDLGSNKMDGTEAAQVILETKDVPVVFLSSHTEPEVVEKTEGITSYGYIVKNSGETVLMASIKMAFRLHDAQVELKRQKETLRVALVQQEETEEQLLQKTEDLDRYVKKLEISEDRFQRTLALVPDMISIHDPDMNILYSNWNGFAAVTEEKRILGTKCYKTYRDFDQVCPDCQAKLVLESKVPFRKKAQIPEGIHFDLRVIPILDNEGNVEMFMEWVRIISEPGEPS